MDCYATFKDAWSDVFASIADGTYKTKYAIGDTVPLDLGSEGVVNMEIVAFDADDLADDSGKAPITWISKELLKTSHRMNPALVPNDDGTYQEGTGSVGGWEKCEMRSYLKNTIKPLIPETVRNAITSVTKHSMAYDTAETLFESITTEDVWIPSFRELFSDDQDNEANGPIYAEKFNDDASRKKDRPDGSAPHFWLTRTAYLAGSWYSIACTYGDYRAAIASNICCVALGFCT